jgi:hypothetical protein
MNPSLNLARYLALGVTLSLVLMAGGTSLAQEASTVAPATAPSPSTSVTAVNPDDATAGAAPSDKKVEADGAPAGPTNGKGKSASSNRTVSKSAEAGLASPSPDSLAPLAGTKPVETVPSVGADEKPASVTAAPESALERQRQAEAQALGRVSPNRKSSNSGSRQEASTRRAPSAKPTSPKPSAPPLIGGVYYPPSSPVYEAQGYTWGYQPGRYIPRRYETGRYTPGRYTPGRYVPPGGAAAALMEPDRAKRSRSSRSNSVRRDPSSRNITRAEIIRPTRPSDPGDRPAGRWDDQTGATRIYGQFGPLPGNGAIAPGFEYGLYGIHTVIVEPGIFNHHRRR